MSGGIYHNFKPGRAGASAANARYISRPSAVLDGERGIYEHNLPSHLRGENPAETRTNLVEYARQREEDERAKPVRGGGEARTHYRAQLSFEGKIDSEQAREMAGEYMRENFPNARGFAAIHQDTEHTHAHIWVDARQIDGKKLNIPTAQYKRLDESWARTYGREFGREKEQEHLRKKEQTREYKRAYARGEQPERRPERSDRRMTRDDYRERERGNYGTHEARARGDQPRVADGERTLTPVGREQARAGEPDFTRGERSLDRAAGAAFGAVREAESLRDELARMGERQREMNFDRGR